MANPLHYVRVKRQKTTVFLEATHQDTIGALKLKLSKIQGIDRAPDQMKLFFGGLPLDHDNRNLGDYKVENDDVLGIVFKNCDDTWEEEAIVPVSQPPSFERKAEENT